MTRRNSDGRVQFFYAADASTEPSSWTQLGTDQTAAGTVTADTNNVYIGCISNFADHAAGKFYRAIVRSGIGGTTVLDIDFTSKQAGTNSFTEASSNAATVTVNETSNLAVITNSYYDLILSVASAVLSGAYWGVKNRVV